ncbi:MULTISPECIES: RusA family crossover junction endodeoxyribonuclease [Mumia]|uniref:RusA family crossover junction endodeoxyribonuclease n=1 Tax=Mumia xiangluensis TaxID=1678900 RepID=A0ABW1QKL4_9ACTN|nr:MULTISPECIES: RusA family crossover junction endodeoxyribonuclease [Mumia]
MIEPVVSAADFVVHEYYDQGKIVIRSAASPVSLQANTVRKKQFRAAFGAAVQEATRGIFTHDVEVTLVWLIEEARRYQTHLVADLDNVLKPLLDAITGPGGVFIDDNQVQSIRASWMTPGAGGPGFELTIEALMGDDYVERAGLSFVEFSADRCYMLHGGLGPWEARVVAQFRRMVAAYHSELAMGFAEDVARMILPIARPFPRARLGRFRVRHESEFPDPDS